jgi:hypothetical protein
VRRQSGETRLTPGLATNLDTSGSGCRLACGALIRSGKVVFLSGSARIVVEFPADEYITLAQSLPSSKGEIPNPSGDGGRNGQAVRGDRLFSPERNLEGTDVKLISSADRTIDVDAYVLTDTTVA